MLSKIQEANFLASIKLENVNQRSFSAAQRRPAAAPLAHITKYLGLE